MEILAIAPTLVVFVFGACIGSFLNVVVYRLPAGLSIVYPASHCPRCQHQLGKTENVPILGWLMLKGRCSYCKTTISFRYPLIEAVTGIMFLIIFGQFGYSVETIGYWILFSWLLSLTLIDFDTMTLPASLTKSGLVLGLVFQVIIGWSNSGSSAAIANAIFGIAGATVGIWLLETIRILGTIIFQQEAMGDADGKLLATIGAWVGWKSVLVTCFVACGLGAVLGGGAMALGLLNKKQPMPFGPFLALGGILSLFYGEAIADVYVNTFFVF
ncbi:A24 family peptidase [Myxosarcina sp. GI1]|uniref:prepilin peptidase n=1 Tax=Myxosarcina sp. GI1 TaxID=1541065 RepID=UPI00055F54F8|nr:A24 family peptidase [Myxosarcina sp. GI1]